MDAKRIARIARILSRAADGHTVGADIDHGPRTVAQIVAQANSRATVRGESVLNSLENAIDFGA